MYDFNPEETIESAVCPGVKFTIRKPTVGKRAQLAQMTAAASKRYQEKISGIDKLRLPDKKKLKVMRDGIEVEEEIFQYSDQDKAVELSTEATIVQLTELDPIYVRWGLSSISGFSINGEEVTQKDPGDIMLQSGPEDLVYEITNAIKKRLGMTVDDQKNSKSPTTSPAVDGEIIRTTTAGTVSPADWPEDLATVESSLVASQ